MTQPWSTSTEPVTVAEAVAADPPDGAAPRRLDRPRRLPGGRAVLGALLVTLAVVGVVAAHLTATAAPRDRYLIAAGDLPAGTVFRDAAAVRANLRQVAVDLPAELAARAVHVDAAGSLVGRRLLTALAPGDLLLTSGTADVDAARGTSTFAFAIPADAAVGGALSPGDRIDVVATAGTGAEASTAYVVRAAPLAAVAGSGGGLEGESLRLTVELARATDVQALAHALATAEVVVVRSPDATTTAPAPYRYDPDAPGLEPAAEDARPPKAPATAGAGAPAEPAP